MIFAVEQSTGNLTGAFLLILVIIAMSFLAGFGLCFILLHRRSGSGTGLRSSAPGPLDQPPGYGAADPR